MVKKLMDISPQNLWKNGNDKKRKIHWKRCDGTMQRYSRVSTTVFCEQFLTHVCISKKLKNKVFVKVQRMFVVKENPQFIKNFAL